MNSFVRCALSGLLIVFSTMMISSCVERGTAMATTSRIESRQTVNAPAGDMQGSAEGELHVFKGIPYAAPPTGSARWQPPRPLPRWTGVREVTEFSPACPQLAATTRSIYAQDLSPVNEDCLTLNIWAPADATDAPVFFWIHGGSLVAGSSKEPFYDGTRLAEQGIIVVTINYRLGVLGYLAHPELSAESPLGVSGNYGLLDQIEALRWVNKNISAFGGDPSRVTIAGESAGALSVMYLLAAPDARGLFARAIMESAYMISTPELKKSAHGQPSAEDIGTALVAKLQVSDIKALRQMDAQKLAHAAAMTGYFPLGAVDGKIFPRQLVDVFAKGEQAPVPLLAGFNSGEIRSLTMLAPPPPKTPEEYESIIRTRYVDLADEFLRLYPGSNMQESIFATTRDALYGWTAERLIRKQTEIGQPSYLYLFDHGYPSADAAGLHAFHASELPYVFGTYDRTPSLWPKIPGTPKEGALSTAMIAYWSSFTRDGQPRAADAPDWLPYGSAKAYMRFEDIPRMSEHLLPGMYELHQEAVCRRQVSGKYPWNWNAGILSPELTAHEDAPCL